MAEKRRKYDPEFREGAVRIVTERGKPIAQVARDLGIDAGTLGSWVARTRRTADEDSGRESEQEELQRLRRKNAELAKENAQLAMERDVLKRCMVLWVK
jgi:transposase